VSGDEETFDLVVRGLTREEVERWARSNDSGEDYYVLALAARERVAEWEREERDATSYTDGAESFRRHLRVSPLDDLPGVCIEVEMEEMSGEAHADIDVPWARLLPLLNRVREQRGLPRLVEELPSDPLRLDIGAAEFAAAVGDPDVHAVLAEVRALGERATRLGPAERADEDSP
jgi:hypothetical protein